MLSSRQEHSGRAVPHDTGIPNARLPTRSGPHNTASNYYQYPQSSYTNSVSDVDRYTRNDHEGDNRTLSTTQSFEGRPNDEDCVSFFSSPTPTPMDPNSDGSDLEIGYQLEDSNLTTFGPRMRFVSPPPWESQPADSYDDEEDNVSLSDGFSVFSGRFASRKHRHQEKVSIRSLALASMRSPSPTPTTSSRRNPYGANYSKGSQSQVSLLINQPGDAPWNSRSTLESSSSERPSFSFSFHDKIPSSCLPTEYSSSKQREHIQHSPLSQDSDATSVFNRSDSPASLGPYTHPYANPDVIPISSSTSSRKDIDPTTTGSHQQQRQSNEGDPGYVRRASESAAATVTHATLACRKGSAGNLPVSHPRSSTKPLLSKHDENETIPMPKPIVTTGLPMSKSHYSPHSPVSFPDSPMNSLLTLEEAQRIKKSSSSIPESPTRTRILSGSTLVAGVGLSPGVKPDFEVKRNQSLSPSDTSSTFREIRPSSNARQRTISSSKLSIINSSPSQDDVGFSNNSKSLKHKKSGFMKLFGKDKDAPKEPPSPKHKATVPFTEPIPPVPKRISPPSLSVVVTSPSLFLPEAENHNTSSQQRSSPPTRHNFPTSPSVSSKPLEFDRLPQPSQTHPVASAPPSQTTFESLSLRPVSTIFSAKFSELFSTLEDQSEPLAPPVMPAAASLGGGGGGGEGSPTRSDFSSRSNSSDYPLTPSSTTVPVTIAGLGRQEDSIESLQAQLANMQKNHQRQIWELEGQIRDLKQENETYRDSGTCESCGRSKREGRLKHDVAGSVVDRPRPKTSKDARSVFGGN